MIKRILFYGIAAILVFSPIARGAVRIWSLAPILIVTYGLIFIWLWNISKSHEPRAKNQYIVLDALIWLFVALAALSAVFSIYKYNSAQALAALLAYIGIYYLVLNNFDPDMRKRLLFLVIGFAAVLSIYGILQYFGVSSRPWWDNKRLLSATYVNHNHFAGFLELVIPVSLGAFLSKKLGLSLKARLFLLFGILVMIIAFVLAQSRGAWLGMATALFIMNIALIKKGRLKIYSIIIFLLLVAFVFSMAYYNEGVVSKRIDTITNIEVGEASWQTRLKIWRGTIDMIRHNPLTGVGIGNFSAGFPEFLPKNLDRFANFSHNDYLEIASEMGIFAPFITLWLFILAVTRGLRKTNSSVIIGCAAGALSLALHGFVDFNFHIPANMILLSIWLALVVRGAGEVKIKGK